LPAHIHIRIVAVFLLLILSIVSPVLAQTPASAAAAEAPSSALPALGASLSDLRTQEDFTSLTLAGSDLQMTEPIEGGHQETPEFIRDLYQVSWRSLDSIDLYIIRPAKAKNPPVVIYLYGFPSDTARFRDDAYCQRLVRNGSAAVGFVSALTGPRFHHRPLNQWFVSELQESLATTVHDVQMTLNLLEKRGDVDMSRVGIFGQGSGGAIAILAAAADPRIKALDLLQPWGDWPNFLAESLAIPNNERPNYLKPEFLKKVEPLEPMHYLPELKNRSIRIQFVAEPAPMKWPKHMEEAAPATAKIVHFDSPSDLYSTTSGGRLFQWIGEQLKSPAAGAEPVRAKAPSTMERTEAQQ
jgi:hypothetical protein